MSLFEIDPAEFMPRKSNRTYQRGVRHTPSTQPPEPKHYSWNKDFLSTEHLPFYVGNQVPDPGLRRPHLLQDSSLFYVDEMKEGGHKEKLIKTRAKILKKLSKKMRPLWRKELEDLNLSPDNTTLELTDSMQVEMNNYLKSHLFAGTPGEDTINTLTDEVYKIAQERQNMNKSVGHILIGAPPKQVPLLEGTVHVKKGNLGEFYLRYKPRNEPVESHDMNGTIRLHDVRLNITHMNAATKLLRNILTLRPRDLTYSQAENALSKIFVGKENFDSCKRKKATATTTVPITTLEYGDEVYTSELIGWKSGVVTEDTPTVTQEQTSSSQFSDLLESNLRSRMSPFSYFTTPITFSYPKSSTISSKTSFPITSPTPTTTSITTTPIPTTAPLTTTTTFPTTTPTRTTTRNLYLSSPTYPTTSSTSTTNAFEIVSTQSNYLEEINKLRETISMSRNISSILMEEMELRQRESDKLTDQSVKSKPGEKIASVGNWKLQQRIRDFKPDRSYPTMPPFVRKWPTFRPHPRTHPPTIESDNRQTFVTMRPKYKGPRHEPFFFDDFKRIRTIYPPTYTTGQILLTTVLPTEGSRIETDHDKPSGSWKTNPSLNTDPVQSSYKMESGSENILNADSIPQSVVTEYKYLLDTSIKIEPESITYTPNKENDLHELEPSTDESALRTDDSFKEKYPHQIHPSIDSESEKRTESVFRKQSSPTSRKPNFVTINISGRVHTIRPLFIRSTIFPTTPTPTIKVTTTKKTPFHHAIKHHVKKGLNKLFSFFGFGKSKKE